MSERQEPLVVIRGERVTLEFADGQVLKKFARGTVEDRKRRAQALREKLAANGFPA